MLPIMDPGSLVAALLSRERIVVFAAIGAAIALAWGYLLWGAGMDMSGMARMPWSTGHAAMMLVMWWIMMVAMMLPSAAPMIVLFAALERHATKPMVGGARVTLFAFSYTIVWGAFSVAAVALQWALDAHALLSPVMATTSGTLGGTLLVGAGIWQFTPMKSACLSHCRSPAEFLMRHRQQGATGALTMGIRHGLFCLGCCWLMMLLLFYGGVMNLLWIIGLAVVILVEKLAPAGPLFGRLTGVAFIAAGAAVLVAAA